MTTGPARKRRMNELDRTMILLSQFAPPEPPEELKRRLIYNLRQRHVPTMRDQPDPHRVALPQVRAMLRPAFAACVVVTVVHLLPSVPWSSATATFSQAARSVMAALRAEEESEVYWSPAAEGIHRYRQQEKALMGGQWDSMIGQADTQTKLRRG